VATRRAGRLTAAELTTRSDAAATARTLAELDELLADLPVLACAFALALHGLRAFGRLPPLRLPAAEPPALAPPTARLDQLTAREREILVHVGQARSNKQIALELTISERTACTHVSNILRKLDLSSRTRPRCSRSAPASCATCPTAASDEPRQGRGRATRPSGGSWRVEAAHRRNLASKSSSGRYRP
jgi:DNA-binding CsgD family transcriptional regulator